VRTIRSVIGEVSLSTDIIFGFPGETDEEANETLKVMEEATFHNGFIFKYSPREHTYASGHLKDDVPEEVKVDRIKIAVERQHRISLYLNQKMVGKRVQVLVEGISRRSNQDLIGRDIWGQKVIFPGEANAIGSLCEVDIIGATSITMLGNQTQG
jgi:tRNA-2-methylthio-N6-dimethylallyladenosine synthase